MLKNKKSEDWKKMFIKHVFIGSVLRINVKIYKILLIIGRKIIQIFLMGKRSRQILYKENTWMTNKQIKMLNIINCWGMFIKTTMKCHYTSTRIAKFKTPPAKPSRLIRIWISWNSDILLVGMQNSKSTSEYILAVS